MIKPKNITGFRKGWLLLRVKIRMFFHFLGKLFSGKLSLKNFFKVLKRLLYFLSTIKENKFVKLGKYTRFGLYLPGYPSRAFFTACEKFSHFGVKLPCTTVLVSVTSACRFDCVHCYQKNDKGKDADLDKLIEVVKKLQNMGMAFFNIEGGEPFLVYEKLKRVCEVIDNRSEIWINSVGDGMTLEKLKELKSLNLTAAMFSFHFLDKEEMNKFMGSDNAWDSIMNGIKLCNEAEVPVAFNICLQADDFHNGKFEKLMDKAKELNVSIIQLIKPKPAGGWLESGVEDFPSAEIERVKKLVNKYNNEKEFKDYPSISAQVFEEAPEMFGCTAGGTDRFYINAKGDLQPCEFLNISFGNILTDDFEIIYKEMREQFEGPGEAWLCEKYSGKILKVFKEKKLNSLPLSKELSKEIYENWDRGRKTKLYRIIEER